MQLQMKKRLNELGFTINHYGVIGFFVVVVIALTFATEPLTLQNLTGLKFLKAQTTNQIAPSSPDLSGIPDVSYEGIDSITREKNNLNSLLDPSYGQGSVLGLSTDSQNTINQVLDENSLQNIPVKKVAGTEFNIESYIDQVQLLEAYYGDVLILSSLSSQNPDAASKAIPLVKGLIGELKGVAVPEPLVRYHRLKMMHYAVVLNMAQNIATNVSPQDKSAAGILFFEITNAMEVERASLIQKYSYGI